MFTYSVQGNLIIYSEKFIISYANDIISLITNDAYIYR